MYNVWVELGRNAFTGEMEALSDSGTVFIDLLFASTRLTNTQDKTC